MSNSIYIPYCYLIGWPKHNMYYYGVRTARNCNPSDLFVSYFTSSKQVKRMIKKYGKPDIIQIRKTFKNKEDALIWESKVLRRLNIARRKDFLNLCNTFPDFCTSGYITVKNLKTGKNENVTCEEFENNKGGLYEARNKGYVTVRNIKTGKNEVVTCEEFESGTGILYESITKGKVPVKNIQTGKNENVTCEEYEKNNGILYESVNKGKTHSDETRNKMSELKKGKFKGENNPFYNKHHSEETKKIMSESRKNRIWIVNPNNETKFILSNEFENYSNRGFIKGRKYVN